MVLAWVALVILLVFSVILAFVISTSVLGFLMTRVPYVRTRKPDVLDIVKKLPIRKEDIFFDLGSGDGKVVFLVEKFSGARVRGFELTPWSHLWSRVVKKIKGSSAEMVYGNFFKKDFSEATVIYCYLFPGLMSMIGDKVKAECAPGTKIVSRDFPISNLEQIESWKSPSGHMIFLYQV